MDVYRRYPDRREDVLGALVDKELRNKQEKYDAEKAKANDELMDDAREKMAWHVDKAVNHKAHPRVAMK